jgi:hypothetical protein
MTQGGSRGHRAPFASCWRERNGWLSQLALPVFIGYRRSISLRPLRCNSESIIHTNISGSAWAFAPPSLLTSSACPDEIVVAMDDVGEISISREGTVQMDSAPTMASATSVTSVSTCPYGRPEALGSWYSGGRIGESPRSARFSLSTLAAGWATRSVDNEPSNYSGVGMIKALPKQCAGVLDGDARAEMLSELRQFGGEIGKHVKQLEDQNAKLEARVAELERLPFEFAGTWQQGKAYRRGQFVSWQGGLWHCNCESTRKPGTSSDFTLCCKAGRNAKDAK